MMKIKFFCPYWGSSALSYDLFFRKAKAAGYDGIEMSLPFNKAEKSDILSQLNDTGLELIAQHFETADSDPHLHKENFRKHLYNLAEAKPLLINSQTGKDYFSFGENKDLLELSLRISQETGIPVVHETHRGKFSFAVHVTRQYLEKVPGLELGLDLSHWCNVAESLLQDQIKSVELALRKTRHIHARVGFAEGPQITDPRLPEWEDALQFHLSCWDKVVGNFKRQKKEFLTITPEFGPYPYMQHLPFTGMPVANQWEINVYMMDMLRERYYSSL